MNLQRLTTNLISSGIEFKSLQGIDYVVAPIAMLGVGVVNGSGGPLLYEQADIANAAPSWNHKPIVVYHPTIGGQGVSATDPAVIEAHRVGMLLNTRWEDGKLRSDAWIDINLANKIDERVMQRLEAGEVMEVSTGLFTDNEPADGDFGGDAYNAIARNHRPDHMALLPDKVGAYSVAAGGGLLQMNAASMRAISEMDAQSGIDLDGLVNRGMATIGKAITNAMSHADLHAAISRELRSEISTDPNSMGPWVVDVFDKTFVYDHNEKLYRRGFSKKKNDVTLDGTIEEVVLVSEYKTKPVGNAAPSKEPDMDKNALVAALIANTLTQYTEDHREQLMELNEDQLNLMTPVEADAPSEAVVVDVEPTTDNAAAPTFEQLLAKAPKATQSMIANGLAAHERECDAAVQQILANEHNPFDEAFLRTKDLAELRGIAQLSGGPAAAPAAPPMFNGNGLLGDTTNNATPTREAPAPLQLTTVNSEDAAAQKATA